MDSGTSINLNTEKTQMLKHDDAEDYTDTLIMHVKKAYPTMTGKDQEGLVMESLCMVHQDKDKVKCLNLATATNLSELMGQCVQILHK